MLQNIEEKNVVETLAFQCVDNTCKAFVQIGPEILLQCVRVRRVRQNVHTRYSIAVPFQIGCDAALSTAEVQHVLIYAHQLADIVMAGVFALFDRVMYEVFLKLGMPFDGAASLLVTAHSAEHMA